VAWGKFDESEAPAYFKRALDVGITFFDTADTYNVRARSGGDHRAPRS
jgi:aryl-alcohol dehydrogenase-like predicted oxidoreductase